MKSCKNCGKELVDDAVVCPGCGVAQMEIAPQIASVPVVTTDSESIGWGFLGFCVPVVGLALYLVWKDCAPQKAKRLGIGALSSVIALVLFYIFYIFLIMVMMMM